MKKVYTEKGKNYFIRRDKIVKIIDYEISGNREIQDTLNKKNTFANIRKLNKYEYEVLDTGEIKRYKQGANKNQKGLKRSMKNLRKILKNNFSGEKNELFVTLTSEKEIVNIKDIKKKYQKFWKKIKRMYSDMEAVAIFEKNSKGNSWHIHCIMKATRHRSIYISNSKIEGIWKHGYTKTSRIVDYKKENEINEQGRLGYKDMIEEKFGIDKVISYMCKTETKEEIPTGERCYEISRGIKKPTEKQMKYDDIIKQMGQKYKLKSQNTMVVREELTNSILNKIKIETWKKKDD